MNATRATAVTTDGGVFGATTETPPEDPPPDDSRVVWAVVLHILIHVVIHIAKTDYNHENNFQFNPQVDRIRMDADRFRDTQTPRSINNIEPLIPQTMKNYNRFILESMRPTVVLHTENNFVRQLIISIRSIVRRLNRSG